jgi:phosphatidylethanolamine/phosphatidyl-N-methylethanolamine N-methyltransferase
VRRNVVDRPQRGAKASGVGFNRGLPHLAAPMKPFSHQRVALTYDHYAPLYDRLFGAVLEPGRRALTAAVREVGPSSLLEIGVGTGLTLGDYPEHTCVTGIDLSHDMLERARRRALQLNGRRIDLRQMDAEHIAFPDATFDCVTLPYVLSVTPDPSRLVAEVRRVCRPGGLIVVVNHFSGSHFWWFMERAVRGMAGRIGFRSDFRFDEHILAHPWKVENVVPVNLFGLSRLVVLRNT